MPKVYNTNASFQSRVKGIIKMKNKYWLIENCNWIKKLTDKDDSRFARCLCSIFDRKPTTKGTTNINIKINMDNNNGIKWIKWKDNEWKTTDNYLQMPQAIYLIRQKKGLKCSSLIWNEEGKATWKWHFRRKIKMEFMFKYGFLRLVFKYV